MNKAAEHIKITSCLLSYTFSRVLTDEEGTILAEHFALTDKRPTINVLDFPENEPLRVRALRIIESRIQILDDVADLTNSRDVV